MVRPMRPLRLFTIYDSAGNVVSQSRNLRGIRAAVGKQLVRYVSINRRPHGEGGLIIVFSNGNHFMTDFASFAVLKNAIRNWRNLYGAKLIVDDAYMGKVEYDNPALFEGRTPRMFLF